LAAFLSIDIDAFHAALGRRDAASAMPAGKLLKNTIKSRVAAVTMRSGRERNAF